MIEQGASEDEIKAVIARARQFYAEHKYVAPLTQIFGDTGQQHGECVCLERAGRGRGSARAGGKISYLVQPNCRVDCYGPRGQDPGRTRHSPQDQRERAEHLDARAPQEAVGAIARSPIHILHVIFQ